MSDVLAAGADLVVALNASGLAEDAAAEAYASEVAIKISDISGYPLLDVITVYTSVSAVASASRSGWGAVPSKSRCASATFEDAFAALAAGEAAFVEVEQTFSLPLSLCDFEGIAVAHGLPSASDPRMLTATLTPNDELSQLALDLAARAGETYAASYDAVVVYAGGALYQATLALPFLGNFTLSALLGGEPVGTPLLLAAACPAGLLPMASGVRCGCAPGTRSVGGVCKACQPGTANGNVGGFCRACSEGTYAGEGFAECLACPRGTYNPRMMQAKCTRCASGKYSAPGATGCEACGLRDWRQQTALTRAGVIGSTSPFGIDCAFGVVGYVAARTVVGLAALDNGTDVELDGNGNVTNGTDSSFEPLGVLSGHWAAAPVDETNANVTRVWACDTGGAVEEACLGGLNSSCRAGHTGVLCASCFPGYYKTDGLCHVFDGDDASVVPAFILGAVVILVAMLVGLVLALMCCRFARPTPAPPKPPWELEEEGEDGIDSDDDVTPHTHTRFDVFVHREADELLPFAFGESIVHDLRRFGIDAKIEHRAAADHTRRVHAEHAVHTMKRLSHAHYGESHAGSEEKLRDQMATLVQKAYRSHHAKKRCLLDLQGNLEDATVCIFFLSDSFFFDKRSLALITMAVELGKHVELVVVPGSKWGPLRDRPFPENVFNPTWAPFMPELSPAFAAIAITWEVDYKPACVLELLLRLAPRLAPGTVNVRDAKVKCTAAEDDLLRRATQWQPREGPPEALEWDWNEKVFDAFLSHKITDAKDIVLSWYNTLYALKYKPFLDRLTLDKVENIPTYVEQTVTMVIAVTSNLFVSYWCGVELCKAVDCHMAGTLNILLVPIQGEMWAVPDSDAKLDFPTPELVMANFGKWFPDLPDATRKGIELLYGGGAYTRERMIPHTLMHYMPFERLFVARLGLSIGRHVELAKLVAAGSTTAAEVLEGLAMHIDEANAIMLQRTDGDESKATVYEIKLPGAIGDGEDGAAEGSERIDQRLGFAAQTGADSGELNAIVIAEKLNGLKVTEHSIDDFGSMLHVLRAEASLLGSTTTKLSGALEAFMATEDIGSISFGDVWEAVQPATKSFGQMQKSFVGLFQVNSSFTASMPGVAWPAAFDGLMRVFGIFSLDFLGADAFAKWTGRTVHYASSAIGVTVAFVVLLVSIPAWHRLLLVRWVAKHGGPDATRWLSDLEDRIVRAVMVVTTLCYPVVAAQLLMLYRGVDFNDERMLEADLRLTMDDAWIWQLMGLPFIVTIVCGVPVAFLVILYRVARPAALAHLKPKEAAQLERRYLLRYGQLYQLYKGDCWWWELVEIWRKLLLIAVLGFFNAGSLEQLWFAIVVSLTAILMLTAFKPYINGMVAAAAWATQTATLLTLFGAVALRGAEDPECYCDDFRTAVEVALPVVNVLPLLMIVYLLVSVAFDVRKSLAAKFPAKDAPAALKDEAPTDEQIAATAGALAKTPEASHLSSHRGSTQLPAPDPLAEDSRRQTQETDHRRTSKRLLRALGSRSSLGTLVHPGAARRATAAPLKTSPPPSLRMAGMVKTPLGLGVDFGASNVVEAVRPDSQAARAGMVVGERLATFNGASVATAAELEAALAELAIGAIVVLGMHGADGGSGDGSGGDGGDGRDGGEVTLLWGRFHLRRSGSITYKPIHARLVGPSSPSSPGGGSSSSPSPPPLPAATGWTAFEYDVGNSGAFSDDPVRVPFAAVSAVSVTEESNGLEFDIEYARPSDRARTMERMEAAQAAQQAVQIDDDAWRTLLSGELHVRRVGLFHRQAVSLKAAAHPTGSEQHRVTYTDAATGKASIGTVLGIDNEAPTKYEFEVVTAEGGSGHNWRVRCVTKKDYADWTSALRTVVPPADLLTQLKLLRAAGGSSRDSGSVSASGGWGPTTQKTLRIRVNSLAEFMAWRQAFGPKLVIVQPRLRTRRPSAGAGAVEALDRARAWLDTRESEDLERHDSPLPSPPPLDRQPASQQEV